MAESMRTSDALRMVANEARQGEWERAVCLDGAKYMERMERELSAYRTAEEQRNKGCEHCTQEEAMAYGEDGMKRSAYIYLDGNLLTADLYSDSMAVAICFCPMCGRKLKENT